MLIRLEKYGSHSVVIALIFSYGLKILNIYSFNSKLEIEIRVLLNSIAYEEF